MTLSHNDIKDLIALVLAVPKETARTDLNTELKKKGWSEPQFYQGVLDHGPGMQYTAEEWFVFHARVPHFTLRDWQRDHRAKKLMEKMSEQQRQQLPATVSDTQPVLDGELKREE